MKYRTFVDVVAACVVGMVVLGIWIPLPILFFLGYVLFEFAVRLDEKRK